ncbi:MAG TPA: TIGR01777 family oxidoreductase [Chthonomonadales bacterium]|nr:TIGR01777 family oxidoreductase [Chthonomonadales bacterium]
MNVVIAGATGFIGQALCRRLAAAGHTLTALTRNPQKAVGLFPADTRVLAWSTEQAGKWQQVVAEAEVVVNLAGESIAGRRWTDEYKQRIRQSRLDTTRGIVAAMVVDDAPERVLLNASAVGYYGDRGEAVVTEQTPSGSDFLARLCVDWEAEALQATAAGVRVVLMRTGIVLGEGGGVLEKMVPPFKWFVGGPLGLGKQWVPWIHIDDHLEMIVWAMENGAVSGPINFTAPHPVTMREFANTLGKVLNRPALFPVPRFVLQLMLGEGADAVLASQKVIPQAAQQLGFEWRYPHLEPALRAIFRK